MCIMCLKFAPQELGYAHAMLRTLTRSEAISALAFLAKGWVDCALEEKAMVIL